MPLETVSGKENCFTPSPVIVCLKPFDMKFVPLSLCISFGRPYLVKKMVNASTTGFVFMLPRGMASANRVATSIIVRRNIFPDFVRGNGPTQSIKTLLKGSPTAGIGIRGAGGMACPFPTI